MDGGRVTTHGAMKRIMQEVAEMEAEARKPNKMCVARPLESDLFEWHFSIKGPAGSHFEGGVYHGRILLPAQYPHKPPEIIMLTPNGRFECGTRICLSVTSFHQETWLPSWSIRTILTALVAFFPSESEGIGSLHYPEAYRRQLARQSKYWRCPTCGAHPYSEFYDVEDEDTAESAASAEASATEPASEEPVEQQAGSVTEQTAEPAEAAKVYQTALATESGDGGGVQHIQPVPAAGNLGAESGNLPMGVGAETMRRRAVFVSGPTQPEAGPVAPTEPVENHAGAGAAADLGPNNWQGGSAVSPRQRSQRIQMISQVLLLIEVALVVVTCILVGVILRKFGVW